jgi:hypothetical protein
MGCTFETSPAPEVTEVVPREVSTRQATMVTIVGRNFLGSARLALGSRAPVSIDLGWSVGVSDRDLNRESVTVLDESTLRALVPAELPLGPHRVSVTSPSGQSASLEAGVEVIEGTPEKLLDQVPGSTCTGACAEGCEAGDDACCRESCSDGQCPACDADCSCHLDCQGVESCDASCPPGGSCWLTSRNTGGSSLECQSASCAFACSNGSSCDLYCEGGSLCELSCADTGGCHLACGSGSACLMRCERSTTCVLTCENPVDCPDGSRVCNRPCP